MTAVTLPAGLPKVVEAPVLGVVIRTLLVGNTRQNSPTQAMVEIANHGAGGSSLTVLLSSTCSWIRLTPPTLTVAPGTTERAQLEIVPGDSTPLGDFVHEIAVHAPSAVVVQHLTIEVRGRVIKDVAVVAEPAQVDFGTVAIGNSPASQLVSFITNDSDYQAQITNVVFEAPDGLRQSVEVRPRGGGKYEIALHGANREPGEFQGCLVATDKNPDLSEARVRVSGTFVAPPRMQVADDVVLQSEGLRGQLELPVENAGGQPLEVSVDSAVLPMWLKPTAPSVTIPPRSAGVFCFDYDFSGVSQDVFGLTLNLISNDNGYAGSVRRL